PARTSGPGSSPMARAAGEPLRCCSIARATICGTSRPWSTSAASATRSGLCCGSTGPGRSGALPPARRARLTRRPAAEGTLREFVRPRGAVLPAEIDDLQVAADPFVLGEEGLQVALGLHHVAPARETPARREPV